MLKLKPQISRILGGVLAIFVLGFILISCTHQGDDNSEEKVFVPKVETQAVAVGFSRELTMTGEIQAQKSAQLTSELRADVTQVLVKNGDMVKRGDVLIRMHSDSIASSLSTSQTASLNAQQSLQQTELSVQKTIESAHIALETAQTNLSNTLKQNAATRKQAEETLNATKIALGLSTASAETTLENAVRSAYPTAQAAIADADEIIGVSETYRLSNDDFERFLGSLNSVSKMQAETSIKTALSALEQNFSTYDSALNLLEVAEDAVTATLNTLNNSMTSVDFTQTTLNTYIASTTANLASIRGAISTLKSAKAALDSAKQDTSGGDSQTLLSAQANYDATITGLEASEESARKAVESAQAALESAEKSANLSRIGAKASLDSARGSLDQALINQNKLIIQAPFDGKVTSVDVEIGDEVSVGNSLVSVEDDSRLKIVTYLSSDEVEKVKVGDTVKIGSKSEDRIASISPSADPITKKYKIEIYHQNPYLKAGEFVRLRFQLGERNPNETRIFLPINAINILSYGNFVWKIVDGKAVKQAVTLGSIEGEFVEIKSGLNLGEEVIVEGGRILDTSKDNLDVEIIGETQTEKTSLNSLTSQLLAIFE